ncbi:MAG: ribonuclease HIII [Candidatus Aenigmarchaeota archaeon]|nr:ribonuclease HIII [Candidatus Aenigmarchaeota archaeon]
MKQGSRLLEVYEHIKSILKVDHINVSDYQLIDYGLQFTVSILDWSGIIRIYQNKKGVLKIDYSQLKGGVNAINIQNLIEGKKTPFDSNKKGVELGFPIIGTDESGKGDYFGPLVSAGVYVDEQSARGLIVCGVKDSKKLNDGKNIELAHKIAEICKGHFSIIEISPERYNDLYDQFKKERKNLNTLLAWGHAKAIEEILSKVDCKIAIADQFADEKFILGKLQEKGKKLKLIQMHKAEQNIAVAAASILARARFLEKLSKLSDEYRTNLPKGVSKTVIENARKIVALQGEETLRKVAKLHFKTTAEVLRSK